MFIVIILSKLFFIYLVCGNYNKYTYNLGRCKIVVYSKIVRMGALIIIEKTIEEN